MKMKNEASPARSDLREWLREIKIFWILVRTRCNGGCFMLVVPMPPQSAQRMNSQSWSIQTWCSQQEPSRWDALGHASSVEFLQRLNLPSVHPFCNPQTAPNPYEIPGVPGQGPLLNNDHLESFWDVIITIIAMGAPSLAAMAELWLRLFSSILAPLGVAILAYLDMFGKSAFDRSSKKDDLVAFFTCVVTTASSAVLCTDSLYVLEFGPLWGGTLLAVSFVLSWNICSKRQFHNTRRVLTGLLLLVFILIYDVDTGQFGFGNRRDEVKIEEGLYFDETNKESLNIVNWWPEPNRTYSTVEGATPWLPTGDSRTGIPFLLNKVQSPKWTRVWLPLSEGEVLALDIAFPRKGYDASQPVYLVLHGLNGGSQEEFVKDFTTRRTENDGATVIVMVARGLMDLPIRGMNVFHGARWEDSRDAAIAIRRSVVPGQLLAGVGYSMGAIILSNMVARTGAECALDVAVAVSGGLDMRYEIDFPRAQRLWQPLLTVTLRDTFVVGKWGERVRHRLTKKQMKMLMRATHVSEIDKTAVVVYNGFRDLEHYYSEMSALGDIPFPLEDHAGLFQPSLYRFHNISIPLCVVHAFDDPLVTWRTVASNSGFMHPSNLTRWNSNLFLLLTKRGGHVGWPTGWIPHVDKWKWMSDISASFVKAFSDSQASLESDVSHSRK